MSELLVMVPTRSRPRNVKRFIKAFKDTAQLPAHLLFILDDDDASVAHLVFPPWVHRIMMPRSPVSAKVNCAARWGLNQGFSVLMFLGDDNVCITPGWDTMVMAHLEAMGSGMISVNDLSGQFNRVATNIAITADIVQALGWFDEPTMCHYYVDDVWTQLGREADCLDYLHDVVIEHCHPIYRKAPVDDLYRDTMATYWAIDSAAYNAWHAARKASDLAKVKAVVGHV